MNEPSQSTNLRKLRIAPLTVEGLNMDSRGRRIG